MRREIMLAILALACPMLSRQAHADHDRTALYQAACDYHAAVHRFACALPGGRIDIFDQRMVERLDKAASALCSVTRRPTRYATLIFAWRDIEYLHPRIERALSDPARYPFDRNLAQRWNVVDVMGARLHRQMLIQLAPHIRYPSSHYPTKEAVSEIPQVTSAEPRDPWGFETYRQPFGRPAESQSNRNRKVETKRRNLGQARIGAVLERRFD